MTRHSPEKMSSDANGIRIAHIHPMSLDLFGHRDEQFGTSVRYFLSSEASMQWIEFNSQNLHGFTGDFIARRGWLREAPVKFR